MSDFIFSSKPDAVNALGASLSNIYAARKDEAEVEVYNGPWGSLAVAPSHYRGFNSLETERYICIVIGGPVLYFGGNAFIAGGEPQAGTKAILDHWLTGKADWSEDLSGPFVLLLVDKELSEIECITDMMMFIPLYEYRDDDSLFLGTHIDALAEACGNDDVIDEASLADLVLHNAVTYPHTAYLRIYQARPATIHRWKRSPERGSRLMAREPYWLPSDQTPHDSVEDAAESLRTGVVGYIARVTGSLSQTAQFISAGEDSRALAGMIPQRLARDAYIFLDRMNREGRIAKKVATAYGLNFNVGYRDEFHYLDILPIASRLVGLGHQFADSHVVKFDQKFDLYAYGAVFGGYASDALLKAQYARKQKWIRRLPLLPYLAIRGERRTAPVSSRFFTGRVLAEVSRRRAAHFAEVQGMRSDDAHEWFKLWPATMMNGISNLHSNRRLFASYEVFTCKESIKVAASVPVAWKLNRRLFHRAFKPFLRQTRHILHADGRLPYYSWWANSLIQVSVSLIRKIAHRLGAQRGNQGPWTDWKAVVSSPRWIEDSTRYMEGVNLSEIEGAVTAGALGPDGLPAINKSTLLQICFQLHRRACRGDRLESDASTELLEQLRAATSDSGCMNGQLK